ncbi:winged helix-turn-helix domain-containing protein [Sinorhizobium sp. BG8]|uniref:winged helix-turn-helix domain-containing protein n=1 Tax=Sinorhizobium sp. BG8 TaxID=2613773 RepID=UPI00193E7EE5|nr:winged helix-turn-helix domain-containing protein [Sinorhizobium sp. BG8]QRM55136.1 winged helix-turn-helix transcriptional regulator [Sinorhizobium sp. BG8]
MNALENQSSTPTGDGGVWVTIADLAKRKGVSRQTVHERVARLEKDGLLATRRDGRSKLVELATYDRAVGQAGDAFRESGAETKRKAAAADAAPVPAPLRDAQAERAQYEAKLKALDYAERTGQLLPIRGPHGIETAMIRITEELVRDLNAPFNWITDLMEAARQGEPALRRLLRSRIHEQRQTIANRMATILGEAAEAEKAGVELDLFAGEGE